MDLRPKYKGFFFKIQNILPVPILGRLSRPVEIGGELNLAAKEAIFGGGSIMSWEVISYEDNVRLAGAG